MQIALPEKQKREHEKEKDTGTITTVTKVVFSVSPGNCLTFMVSLLVIPVNTVIGSDNIFYILPSVSR